MDDPEDVAPIVPLGKSKERGACLSRISLTASFHREPVTPLKPATAVQVDPLDARVADEQPRRPLNNRLLGERYFSTARHHLIEPGLGFDLRHDCTREDHELFVTEQLNEALAIRL